MKCKHDNDSNLSACTWCSLDEAEERGYRRGIEDAARVVDEMKRKPGAREAVPWTWVAGLIRSLIPNAATTGGAGTK